MHFSVALFDRSDVFLLGFAACLPRISFDVVSKATDPEEFLRDFERLHPNLVIIGPCLAEDEAFRLCRLITRLHSSTHILLFHIEASDPFVQADAKYSGVAACLPVTKPYQQWTSTIAKLATANFHDEPHYTVTLTRQEREVLIYMAEGETYVEIAAHLALSTATVRNYAQHVIEKFNVHTRDEAVRRARRRGLL